MFTKKQLACLYTWAVEEFGYTEYVSYLYSKAVTSFMHPLPEDTKDAVFQYFNTRYRAAERLRAKFSDRTGYRETAPWYKPFGQAVAAVLNDRHTEDQFALVCRYFGSLSNVISSRLLLHPAISAWHSNNHKFHTGEWQHPVWAQEVWYVEHPLTAMHQCHSSVKDPALVAYTQSASKLVRDIQTPMKPGRYLSTYFSDVLSSEQIKYWANRQVSTLEAGYKLHILKNDEWTDSEYKLRTLWEEMYGHCIVDYSCMRGEYAPSVYGMKGNHLGLVTWAKTGEDNPFLNDDVEAYGRAIIRTDRDPPEFNRVFPFSDTDSVGSEHALQTALQAAGFNHGRDLGGIHLIYEEEADGGAAVVCPYIDGHSQYVQVTHVGKRQVLLIGTCGYEARSTGGVIETTTCDDCGEPTHQDDLHYIEDEDISVCERCLNSNFVYAIHRRDSRYVRSEDAYYCESNEEYYTEDGLEYHGIILIDAGRHRGEYHEADEAVLTSRGWVHTDDAVELNEEDSDGNTWAFDDDVIDTTDGRTIHKDNAITTVDDEVYHDSDDGLLYFGHDRCIHKDNFDPQDFMVAVDTLFYTPGTRAERGAMSLTEWLAFALTHPALGFIELASTKRQALAWEEAWTNWLNDQEPAQLAA